MTYVDERFLSSTTLTDLARAQAFTKSGLASPYASLDAATLYSLFTYHAVPLSLSSAINASSSHTLLETLFPLPNGDGQVMIAERGQPDGLKVVSPVEAKVKTDSLDEGSSSGTLSGLELFEVDTVSCTHRQPSFPRARRAYACIRISDRLLPSPLPCPPSSPTLLLRPRLRPRNPDSHSTPPRSTTPRRSTP